MKIFKIALSTLILMVMVVLCQQVIKNGLENQSNKVDAAELGHIRYGLLSVDTWKEQITQIVEDEIDKLEFTKEHENDLQKTVEKQLNVLIDKVNGRIEQNNKKTVKGRFKQTFIDMMVDIEDIKKGTPTYAAAMIKEMKKPGTQGKVKDLLKDKLNQYFNESFDAQDMSQINRILLKTSAISIDDAREKLDQEIQNKYRLIKQEAVALLVLATILFLLPLLNDDKDYLPAPQYITLVTALLIMLACGVTTPMIDMEAKISQMTFVLLNHPVSFKNQVLFFQSKSVLDVFWIMITHKDFMMKAVGVLMVMFSIVFPVLKLLSSVVYYYNFKNARKNKWIDFFVMKSGKWSMADVMVVAIFMAYIGFNGIITSQLGKLQNATEEIVILSTNGTSLQPGFYLFMGYALLALFLSVYLAKLPKEDCPKT